MPRGTQLSRNLNNKFYNSFSHESDLRLAVGKNQNALSTALLRNSPANKNAPFHNARVSHVRATPPSKHAFSMRDGNFRRRTRSLNHCARSNRRARADPRPTSGGDGDRFRLFLTETACVFAFAIRTVLRTKRATETSKRAFSMRHVGFGRQMRSHNRRARSNRRARAESRKTSGR